MAYDMETTIEATSLSAVTSIAANPPAHPNERLQTNGLPLTLYIARVPGSRDVFLTPIKPREKVVTAYDAQNSLYFLHFNTEDDYAIDSPVGDKRTSANTDASQLPAIQEKPKARPPLPKRPAPSVSPPYPVDDPLPTTARPPSPPKHNGIARKPVNSANTNANPNQQQFLDLPQIPKRPLPTPPEEPPRSIHEEDVHLLRRSEHSDEFNPFKRDYENHPETLKQRELDARPISGSLTLIRRDAGSNEQWNVATIHDPPVHEVSSTSLMVPSASRRTKKGGAPLYLDITNPGYLQYLTSPRTDSRSSTSTTTSTDSDPPPEGTFRRRLYMPGSQHAEHRYGATHRKHLSVSSLHTDELRRSLRAGHDRHHSVDGGLPAHADRRSKGYTFASPWEGGTCEFSTGATGKSLKCRHLVPRSGIAAEVSELRFNLPTGPSTSSKSLSPTPLKQKRSSYFSGRSSRFGSDDGDGTPSIMIDEQTGRIDLSLGQEKAGGGFGGKQAKLGKLIVQPEGLGMLDLLVAANLGLWWRAYERV